MFHFESLFMRRLPSKQPVGKQTRSRRRGLSFVVVPKIPWALERESPIAYSFHSNAQGILSGQP